MSTFGSTAKSVVIAPGAKSPGKVWRPVTAEQKKQVAVVAGAAGIVLLIGYSIYAYFDHVNRSAAPPRLNAPPTAIARFVGTPNFDQLPYDRQRLYMKELSGKRPELEADYKAGKLTPQQWQETMAVLWLGKQFKHIDRYKALGNLDKKIYLDELINDEVRDDIEDASKPRGTLKRDKEKAQRIVGRFPEAVRVDYERFRHALKEREKERDKEAKAAKKAAKAAATRPTTRGQTETSQTAK
jgi:hypothetical protein